MFKTQKCYNRTFYKFDFDLKLLFVIKTNMTFLFDTICDDIIGEITKYIVWTKDGWWNSTLGVRAALGADDHNIRIQRLLIFPLEKPIITLDVFGWKFSSRWKGSTYEVVREVLKNKIKTNKKGLITYTHKYRRFKQINYLVDT